MGNRVVNELVQRRLAAILAADVVGFSSLMERDEEGTYARIGICEIFGIVRFSTLATISAKS